MKKEYITIKYRIKNEISIYIYHDSKSKVTIEKSCIKRHTSLCIPKNIENDKHNKYI